jgi:NTP pyrophosphatase (non-canonical NTP hydrolase)
MEIKRIMVESHETAVLKGWWDGSGPSEASIIANFHGEISEAWEAMRIGNPPDRDCPEFSSVSIELADEIIRIADYCEAAGIDLNGAIRAKMDFNKTRPIRHGGKKY